MANDLEETVTIKQKVDRTTADLVGFYRYVVLQYPASMDIRQLDDTTLIAHARAYWDREHGE